MTVMLPSPCCCSCGVEDTPDDNTGSWMLMVAALPGRRPLVEDGDGDGDDEMAGAWDEKEAERQEEGTFIKLCACCDMISESFGGGGGGGLIGILGGRRGGLIAGGCPSPLPGYGGGGLSGMSEFVEGLEAVDRTDTGEWFVPRGTRESEHGDDTGVSCILIWRYKPTAPLPLMIC